MAAATITSGQLVPEPNTPRAFAELAFKLVFGFVHPPMPRFIRNRDIGSESRSRPAASVVRR